MTSTQQGPHSTSLGNKLDPRVDSSTASNTAGPHSSNIANKLDPRVDSDLNNRAQYAPGTTTTGNAHEGATTQVSNPASANNGPHPSSIENKLDPRVNSKTGETTTKTTNQTGTGANRAPVVGGSSTGAPSAPLPTSSNTNNAGSASTGYNPATGTGYQAGTDSATASNSYGNSGTATTGTTGTTDTTGTTGTSGSKTGGLKGALAGIHGVGESIRGSIGKAVDDAFGDKEGVAKNEAVTREGQREIQTGNFAESTKAREGTQRRF
ncbi:hypothetical protein DTO166G5_936 [Paecilomyces variotii]|nr:hypothetical protein DTO166G5_936 [Paecilomyces variotii]